MTGLDEQAVTTWIRRLPVGAVGELRFDRIGNGQSNLTYLVRAEEGRRWVLRRPPWGALAATAHDVAREHRILSALAPSDVPVPRVHGLCQDPAVSPAPLMLMEHVGGVVVDDMGVAEKLLPEERRAVGLALVDTLARIHEVDLVGSGLDSLAGHKPYAERQLRRWQRQWDTGRLSERSAVGDLARRLHGALPPPGERTLVHGDFHLQNVIVDPVAGQVRAALDWELCTLGDPIADLGTLLAYWPQPGDPAPAVFEAATLPGFPTRDELVVEYAARTGRSVESIAFWHVLALWKIAVIGEGVLRRALDNPGNAIPVGSTQAVDDLIVRAYAAADQAGI